MNNILGVRLRELRDFKGWSQNKTALKAGISRAALCMIENGQRIPNEDTLKKLFKALNITEEEFYNYDFNSDVDIKLDDILKLFYLKNPAPTKLKYRSLVLIERIFEKEDIGSV